MYRVKSAVTPVRDTSGQIAHFVDIQRDVTEESALEEQLRQAQKMEAVGQLAGGVAHDFNNLLTAILGYSDLMLDHLDPTDPLRPDLEEIKKAGERAASLTRQLLAFSRRQVLELRVLDLNTVVENVSTMLRRLIGEHIELVTALDPYLGSVKADPGQIEQVLLNLAVNARDAMPQDGRLTIETAHVTLDRDYAGQHFPVHPGSYVMLAVTDTGCGMDLETQSHIFEPFTTKGLGKGTGLGLSTVYGIVKQSNGYIWVYSELGQGTSFKVYLPHVDDPAESLRPSARPTVSIRGPETILVVEDEEMVRKLACRTLRSSGYQVLEAANGAEALLIGGQFEGPIHLLITDVVMPQMSGFSLVKRLSSSNPGTKVLYISGYTDTTVADHEGQLTSPEAFLQNPLRHRLLLKVREILDQRDHRTTD